MPYSTVLFRITLSDLAKYPMTWNVARPRCDSWASCFSMWRSYGRDAKSTDKEIRAMYIPES